MGLFLLPSLLLQIALLSNGDTHYTTKMPSSAAVKKSSGQKKVGGKPGKKAPAGQKLKGKGGVKVSKKSQLRFAIDCSHPVEDGIMNCGDFETYLKERIKVAGKTQNFGKDVALAKEKNKIVLTSSVPFSKRYLENSCWRKSSKPPLQEPPWKAGTHRPWCCKPPSTGPEPHQRYRERPTGQDCSFECH